MNHQQFPDLPPLPQDVGQPTPPPSPFSSEMPDSNEYEQFGQYAPDANDQQVVAGGDTHYEPLPYPAGTESSDPQPATEKKSRLGLIATIVAAVMVLAVAVPVGLVIYFNSQPKYLLDSRNKVSSASINFGSPRNDACSAMTINGPLEYLAEGAATLAGTSANDREATSRITERVYSIDYRPDLAWTELEPYTVEVASTGGKTEQVQFMLYRFDTADTAAFAAVRVFDASELVIGLEYRCSPDDANYSEFISALEASDISVIP